MLRPVHFEIGADKPDRAVEFYKKVFDWQITKWDGPQDYWLVMTGTEGTPGINGAIMKRDGGTVNSIEVESVDDFVARSTSAGGTVEVPKMEIPGVGFIAYCKDTEGNLYGLFQPMKK